MEINYKEQNMPQSPRSGKQLDPKGNTLYLLWPFVKHLPCPGELVGVGSVLHPHAADVGRSDRGHVPTDRLLCHIVGQAGAARTSGWR